MPPVLHLIDSDGKARTMKIKDISFSQTEYFLENGNLLSCFNPGLLELSDEEKVEVEIFGLDKNITFVNYSFSTNADRFSYKLYELKPRIPDSGDVEPLTVRNMNRSYSDDDLEGNVVVVDNNEYKIEQYEDATTYDEDDYVEHLGIVYKSTEDSNDEEPPNGDWQKEGKLIDERVIFLEEQANGGPPTASLSHAVERDYIAKFNTKEHNYLFEIENRDSEDVNFWNLLTLANEA